MLFDLGIEFTGLDAHNAHYVNNSRESDRAKTRRKSGVLSPARHAEVVSDASEQ